MSRCSSVAEALVMGEPLSADDQGHVESCEACRRLTALPGLLAASAKGEPPRPGFSARMMVAARDRLAQRRRRRFATFTLAVAAAGASAVVVDRRLVRDRANTPAIDPQTRTTPLDPDLRQELESLQFSSFDRAMEPAVPWDEIEAPVRNYGALLRKRGHK